MMKVRVWLALQAGWLKKKIPMLWHGSRVNLIRLLPSRRSFLEAHQWCRSTDSQCWQRRCHGIQGSGPENTRRPNQIVWFKALTPTLWTTLTTIFLQVLQMRRIGVQIIQTVLGREAVTRHRGHRARITGPRRILQRLQDVIFFPLLV